MKVELGYPTYVTKWVDLPEKFNFIFQKDEDDFTPEEYDLYWEDFQNWKCDVAYGHHHYAQFLDAVDVIETEKHIDIVQISKM